MEELIYFTNDSDKLVQLKAFDSVGKLAVSGYIKENTIRDDIWPQFMALISQPFDEDQSLHFFSNMLGEFLFRVTKIDESLVMSNQTKIMQVFNDLCRHKDEVVRSNSVKYFPCIFQLFADALDDKNVQYFLTLLNYICDQKSQPDLPVLAGSFMHEILSSCE